MQHMPDKDFDNLFRDKFMDAEIEPSTNLWAKIEDQLEPKRKRILPIYWVAAASVAIAFTALLVFQKSDKIQLHPDEVTAVVTNPIEMPSTIDESASTSAETSVVADRNFASIKQTASYTKVIPYAATEAVIKNNEVAVQPNILTPRLDIKRADPKPIDVVTVTPVENPIVMAQVVPQSKADGDVMSEIGNTTERKGIRNVGDLVNYVVDKVDKRDKKIVRFNTDDDDNSSIIGINIGFLKLNKKNR